MVYPLHGIDQPHIDHLEVRNIHKASLVITYFFVSSSFLPTLDSSTKCSQSPRHGHMNYSWRHCTDAPRYSPSDYGPSCAAPSCYYVMSCHTIMIFVVSCRGPLLLVSKMYTHYVNVRKPSWMATDLINISKYA